MEIKCPICRMNYMSKDFDRKCNFCKKKCIKQFSYVLIKNYY